MHKGLTAFLLLVVDAIVDAFSSKTSVLPGANKYFGQFLETDQLERHLISRRAGTSTIETPCAMQDIVSGRFWLYR